MPPKSHAVPARLFSPDYPEPVSVVAEADSRTIIIRDLGGAILGAAPLSVFKIGKLGSGAPCLIFGSKSQNRLVPDSNAWKNLCELSPRLNPSLRKKTVRRRWIQAVFAILTLVAAGIWAAIAGIDAAAGLGAAAINPKYEKALGDLLFSARKAVAKTNAYPEAQESMEAIGARLEVARPSPFSVQWHLLENQSPNAFAFPGGHIVVHTSLMRMAESPDEIAAIMAHEMAHVHERHSMRSLLRAIGVSAAVGLLFGDVSLAAEAILRIESLGYSRSLENLADEFSVQALCDAGFDPRALGTVFRRLQAISLEAPPEWLASHPDMEKRSEAALAQANTLDCPSQPFSMNWDSIRNSLPPVAAH